MRRRRVAALAATAVGLSALMLAVGVVTGVVGRQSPAPVTVRGVVAPPAEVVSGGNAAASTRALQTRLAALPDDWSAWSSLGSLYTIQARLTADPSFYTKADGAFARSLQIRPSDNPGALTGKATLAAARHDFAGALALTRESAKLNPYGATNLGVMSDALSELGDYPQAFTTLQRMVDLKPGVASYSRVSYSYELRGDHDGAEFALTKALEVAQTPADAAFALQYLGELAFNSGDMSTAARHFADGLRRDATYVPLLAGQARVEAATGESAKALRDWKSVTTRLPEPTYLIEYGDLLASLGRSDEAKAQYALVEATARLFRASGANVDLELSLFDADHGRAAAAVRTAKAELDRRKGIHVEDAYAWALHAAGRDQEALVHAKRAARLGTRSALFAYHRGVIEMALGQDAAARTSLRRALDTNPHFSPLLAPKAKAALAQLDRKR